MDKSTNEATANKQSIFDYDVFWKGDNTDNKTFKIFEAIKDDNYKFIEDYLDSGGDVNKEIHLKGLGDTYYYRLLSYAVLQEKTRIVGLLVERGANIHYKDENSRTPAYHAASVYNKDILNILINAGALQKTDLYETTPLHAAAENQDYQLANYIIDVAQQNGVDIINSEDHNGETPLFMTVNNSIPDRQNEDRIRTIKLLISKGADVNAINCKGLTPLYYAFNLSDREQSKIITRILRHFGAKGDVWEI